MAGGTQDDRDWPARVRDAVGAVVALAALVYVAGGLVVGLRLASVDLPTSSVVGQLPRDFLLSVGLSQALFPALFLSGVYAALRSTFFRDTAQAWMKRMFSDRDGRGKALHIVGSLSAALVILAPAVGVGLIRDNSPLHENGDFFWPSLGVIALLDWLLIVLFLNMQARLARKYENSFRSIQPTVLHSLLVAAILVPGCVAFWGYWPLEEASVCMTQAEGEEPVTPSGLLVGETADRVYVGGADRKITAVPTDQVRRLVLGPGAADDGTCD